MTKRTTLATILMAAITGGPVLGLQSTAGMPRRNPSYTKKGPGRYFAGARARLERKLEPVRELIRNGGGKHRLAPCGVALDGDIVKVRNNVGLVRGAFPYSPVGPKVYP